MSTVYQGKQYGKWIIIKRIKPQFKDNEDYKSLFFKEFENAYHLDHPNIVRILDKGEDEEKSDEDVDTDPAPGLPRCYTQA